MSFKAEIQAGDNTWSSNSLRFESEEEAMQYAEDLARRWVLVTNFRTTESPDPVNYQIKNGALVRIAQGA